MAKTDNNMVWDSISEFQNQYHPLQSSIQFSMYLYSVNTSGLEFGTQSQTLQNYEIPFGNCLIFCLKKQFQLVGPLQLVFCSVKSVPQTHLRNDKLRCLCVWHVQMEGKKMIDKRNRCLVKLIRYPWFSMCMRSLSSVIYTRFLPLRNYKSQILRKSLIFRLSPGKRYHFIFQPDNFTKFWSKPSNEK